MRFKYVEPVHSGEPISSASHNDLALAFNQRILSGAGDAAWRIIWNAHSLMRQVRNPAGATLLPGTQQWPASDEWWKMYSLVNNSTTCGSGTTEEPWYWPIAGPGEEEGANVANPMMAFVYGIDRGKDTRANDAEVNRITDGPSTDEAHYTPINVGTLIGNESSDALETWLKAKGQRGWIEEEGPYRATAPAIEAAHSVYGWRYPSEAPYLKTYSTFAPVAKDEGRCPEFSGVYPFKWTAIFTPLLPGYPKLEFPTCPGVAGNLQSISKLDDRYVLYFLDRPSMMLPYNIYIEGPYQGGGVLGKQHSELITQSLNKFVVDMRGSLAERKDCSYDSANKSFNFQRFLATQYAIAPAAGGVYNVVTNAVDASPYDYPKFELLFGEGTGLDSDNVHHKDAGTFFTLAYTTRRPGDSEDTHFVLAPFVFSAFLLHVANVTQATKVEFINGSGQVIYTQDIPVTTTGFYKTVFLPTADNPESVRVRLGAPTIIASTPAHGVGEISVELLIQVPYLPDIQDAYAVLRCGLTRGNDEGGGGLASGPDEVGGNIPSTEVVKLSDAYFKYGCILNLSDNLSLSYHETGVNFNSIYESARLLLHDNLRMVPRTQLIKYEVVDNQTSVYFNRKALPVHDTGSVQVVEEEVKPTVAAKVVDPVAVEKLTPRLEYVVRKSGKDNIKPVALVDVIDHKVHINNRLPIEVYQDPVSLEVYCDDYVIYGNVKYVPPGYNSTAIPGLSNFKAKDVRTNYDHVIVGIPTGGDGYNLLIPDTDVQTFYKNDVYRVRTFTDGFGNARSEAVTSARFYWRSATYNRVETDPGVWEYTREWHNQVQHKRAVGNENPADTTTFRYNNGFRYKVQRQVKVLGAFGPWVDVATGSSADATAQGKYGFEAREVDSLPSGLYYFEDVDMAGKVLGTDVNYRVFAMPVLDLNHSKMVVYQRAYFTPQSVKWTGEAGKSYVVKRVQRIYGEGADTEATVSTILSSATNQYNFVDLPTTVCPVAIRADRLVSRDTYELYDQVVGYKVYESGGGLKFTFTLAEVMAANGLGFVVRPDNILPTAVADLIGESASLDGVTTIADKHGLQLLDTEPSTYRTSICRPKSMVKYKVYGPSSVDGYSSGISFDAPYTTTSGGLTTQTVVIFQGESFVWDAKPSPTAITCPTPPCSEFWQPSPKNFTNVNKIWGTDRLTYSAPNSSPAEVYSQTAYIFQSEIYGCESSEEACGCTRSIENTAGCEFGNFTGVFVKYPEGTGENQITLANFRLCAMLNEPYFSSEGYDMVRQATPVEWDTTPLPYSNVLKLTQWTPWSPKDTTDTFNGGTCAWYMLRTGYERVHLEVLAAPAAGTYSVRGYGYISYNGTKYYAGQSVTMTTAIGLTYTVSDESMRLVTLKSSACTTDLFDFFSGIAPADNLGEIDLRPGLEYHVHAGKGVTYKKKSGASFVPTTVLPGENFIWFAGDHDLHTIDAIQPSKVRALNGIIHNDSDPGVPPASSSNEWCAFLSFNHYAVSNSSLWKPDSYGDIVPFLHNRCHTYSTEIGNPQHQGLGEQFSYGQRPVLLSESPPGYTYLEDINRPKWEDEEVGKNFYKSCQIYKPPYELDSSEIVYTPISGTDADGNPNYDDSVVKVTFKQRFQHTPEAPDIIDDGHSNDEVGLLKLREEGYRTDENGLREYLVAAAGGNQCVRGMTGDSATTYNVFELPDQPFGACHPRMYFVKLVPYVHEDGNTTVEFDQDTLITVDPYLQMDLYLRAMCGGWMDLSSLRSLNCDQGMSSSPVADYLYENLCFQACRSYGSYTDVIPEVLPGMHFLPLKTIGQYDFDWTGIDPDKKLVLEYRSWEMDKCSWGNWTRLEGEITPGNTTPPVGGAGYDDPVTVVFKNQSFMDSRSDKHEQATAVAAIGTHSVDSIAVTAGGTGYNTATVFFSGGGGSGAAATAVIGVSGEITSITIDSAGSGYATPPVVRIVGDGTDATAEATLDSVIAPSGPVTSVTVTNPNPAAGGNYGYTSAPDVTLVGATTGSGAYAVARMEVIDMNTNAGMHVVGVDIVAPPTGQLTSVSIPFNGPTLTPTQFRFTDIADWPNGVRNPSATLYNPSVTPAAGLSFYFLPEGQDSPHKYKINRADYTYGARECAASGWTQIFGGPTGEAGPTCEASVSHFQYDSCTDQCACLWVDPSSTTVLTAAAALGNPPSSSDLVASSYRIEDVSAAGGDGKVPAIGVVSGGAGYTAATTITVAGGGLASSGTVATATAVIVSGVITAINITNHGSGYTRAPYILINDTGGGTGAYAVAEVNAKAQTYYLAWQMQPRVVYNVERRMNYALQTNQGWQLLAAGVRSPFVDGSDWPEDFSRTVASDATKHYVTITPTLSGDLTTREITISAAALVGNDLLNKDIYLRCNVTVTLAEDSGHTAVYPVDEVMKYVDRVDTDLVITDSRTFPAWAGRITAFSYTVAFVDKVTISWSKLPNHKKLIEHLKDSQLVYEVHRKFETSTAGSAPFYRKDEVIARSYPDATILTAPDFHLGATGTSTTASIDWEDWDPLGGHTRLDDWRNNNFVVDGDDGVKSYVNTEEFYVVATWKDWVESRNYRVEATVNAQERWFTSMPMAINVNRPQGFSPVPNTCTYAEMFNNYARAINLLTNVRVELPFTRLKREVSASSIPPAFPEDVTVTYCSAGSSGTGDFRRNVQPGSTPYLSYTSWQPDLISAPVSASAWIKASGISLDGDCSRDHMLMETFRGSTQFAINPEQSCLNAVPTSLKQNLDLSNLVLLGKKTQTTESCRVITQDTTIPGPGYAIVSCCSVGDPIPCGHTLLDDHVGLPPPYVTSGCKLVTNTSEQCVSFLAGTIEPPNIPSGDVTWLHGLHDGLFCAPTGASSSTTISGIRTLVYMTFPLY